MYANNAKGISGWDDLKGRKILNGPPRGAATGNSRALAHLTFERVKGGMKDGETGSSWDWFGRCTKGKLKGKTLTRLQGYKQYVRAWVTFHPDATFYDFQNAGK